ATIGQFGRHHVLGLHGDLTGAAAHARALAGVVASGLLCSILRSEWRTPDAYAQQCTEQEGAPGAGAANRSAAPLVRGIGRWRWPPASATDREF
ncbi:MAG: hypothetical protein KA223_04975, partial [Candidatus Accumulibacter sp.]|nr:hypothetical protein [Accumulibacter sp.]